MKRYWYSTFLAASLAAVIAVEYVPGAVRKLTPWYEAGAMERETDEGTAEKPDAAERETGGETVGQVETEFSERVPETLEGEIPETADGAGTAAVSGRRPDRGDSFQWGGDLSVRGRVCGFRALWSSGCVLKGGFFRRPFHWRFQDRGAF